MHQTLAEILTKNKLHNSAISDSQKKLCELDKKIKFLSHELQTNVNETKNQIQTARETIKADNENMLKLDLEKTERMEALSSRILQKLEASEQANQQKFKENEKALSAMQRDLQVEFFNKL